MENNIKIDEVEVTRKVGSSFSFEGKFSNQSLAGINLEFNGMAIDSQTWIEDILKKRKINVYDPFADREYAAEITQASSSFTVGGDVKSYKLIIREADQVPYFDKIELNNISFNILSYREKIVSETVSRQGVLKLSKTEFDQFRELLSDRVVRVKRGDLDENAFDMRFGSNMFWSEHSEDGSVFFKYIFRLFDQALEPGNLNLASGIIQNNAASMLVNLSSKYEELVNILKLDESLTDDTKTRLSDLSNGDCSSKEFKNNLYDEFVHVADAEKHF